jgi:hypothetical protein
MNTIKIIIASVLFIVISVLLIDYFRTYYFTNKKKKKQKRNRYDVDNPRIVPDGSLQKVSRQSKYKHNSAHADVEQDNFQDSVLGQPEGDSKNAKTLEVLINTYFKVRLLTPLTFLALSIILLGVACIDTVDGREILEAFFAFCMFFYFVIQIKELIYFSSSFQDFNNHLMYWNYPNGDKLLLTPWGLINYHVTLPKLSSSVKFDGFKWDFDNAKDFAESVAKNEGNPLIALIPSIKLSTTSNRVDEYIDFNFNHTVQLIFIEKGRGMLVIFVKQGDTQTTLTYPLPPNKRSLKVEAENFEKKLQHCNGPITALYVERSMVDEIFNQEDKIES